MNLFENNGAAFSICKKHRLYLWRIWNPKEPLLMFIGLNPSTANGDTDDPTIRKITAICKHNGYGGFYMTNLFTFISTDPNQLDMVLGNHETSDDILKNIRGKCQSVVCAWGNFKVIGRDEQVKKMFPKALALKINANGSPKHPLYCKNESNFVNYDYIYDLYYQHDYYEHDKGEYPSILHIHENWNFIDYNTGSSEGYASYQTLNTITGKITEQPGSTRPLEL